MRQRCIQMARHWGAAYMVALMLCLGTVSVAMAQEVPWEAPLTTIQESFSGATGTAILVIALVCFGAAVAFGGGFGILQWGLGLIAGGAIIMKAVDLVGFFGG